MGMGLLCQERTDYTGAEAAPAGELGASTGALIGAFKAEVAARGVKVHTCCMLPLSSSMRPPQPATPLLRGRLRVGPFRLSSVNVLEPHL